MNPESIKYIDCHAHVNFSAYDSDRDEVVKRALESNTWIVNVGTQKDTSKKAVEMAESYKEGVYAIIGTHPIHTDKSYHDKDELGEEGKEFTSRGEEFDFEYYMDLAKPPKVLGIGECGLDYYRFMIHDSGFMNSEEYKKQESAFRKQIELAKEINKPLMLHVRSSKERSAYRDALAILREYSFNKGNFHFFAGSLDEAREIIDAGFNISFTGVITFTKDYDELVKFVPLDRILSETDCPYVTPKPYRGKRNEPVYVQEVVKKVAELKGFTLENTANQIFKNAESFFGFAHS